MHANNNNNHGRSKNMNRTQNICNNNSSAFNNNNNCSFNYRNDSGNAAVYLCSNEVPIPTHSKSRTLEIPVPNTSTYMKSMPISKALNENHVQKAQTTQAHNYVRSLNKSMHRAYNMHNADYQSVQLQNHTERYNSSPYLALTDQNFIIGQQFDNDGCRVAQQFDRVKRQSLQFDNFPAHQHYLHYYSYHNNKLPNHSFESPKSSTNKRSHRPNFTAFTSSAMEDSIETPFIVDALDEMLVNPNRLRGGQANIFEERFNVLREKMPNNEFQIDAHNNQLQYDVGDSINMEKRKNQTSAMVSGSKVQNLRGNSKKKLRTRSASEAVPIPQDDHLWQADVIENNNILSKSVIIVDAKVPPKARLPQIPKDAAKKRPPPRVLLYNTRSPNLPIKKASSPRSVFDNARSKSTVQQRSSKSTIEEEAAAAAAAVALETKRLEVVKQMYTRPKLNRHKPRLPVKSSKSIDDLSYDDDCDSDATSANKFDDDDNDNDDDDVRDPKEDDDIDDVDNISKWGSDDETSTTDSEDTYRIHAYKLQHSYDPVAVTQSYLSSQTSEENIKNPNSLLVPSLFPNMPPYLCFSTNTTPGPHVPAELHRILKWRVTSIMPKVVRSILANSGMRMLKKTNEWMGVWGKHLKAPCFRTIRPYQKINHLPGSFKIGRKDSCWKNLRKQVRKHGSKEFGFMPKTFIFPGDQNDLRKHWPRYTQKNYKWIIKPPASARGYGIKVVSRWSQIPKRRPLIVQRYIERPLLINGSKFDLRLYVLVTCINPLRVFLYQNGLARFAAVKYSDKTDTLNDRCMHLTNYSINKFSSNYSKNEDVNACHGHKWTIKSLFTYLANRGVRTDLLWESLRGLVLRTIMAGENSINNMIKMNVESRYSVYELFGFDVLLDADLVPWLLEVNVSPSLHSELPLDSFVKAPLVQGVLNTALFSVPPKLTVEKQRELATEMNLSSGMLCYDKRLYINYLSRTEKIKHNQFLRKIMDDRKEYLHAILERLTPDDVRCLIIAEDELARSYPLERIFPTKDTHKFLKYTEQPRYYNRLLDAWESRYSNNRAEGRRLLSRLCEQRYHLQVPAAPVKKDSNNNNDKPSLSANRQNVARAEKTKSRPNN